MPRLACLSCPQFFSPLDGVDQLFNFLLFINLLVELCISRLVIPAFLLSAFLFFFFCGGIRSGEAGAIQVMLGDCFPIVQAPFLAPAFEPSSQLPALCFKLWILVKEPASAGGLGDCFLSSLHDVLEPFKI